jgi:hypothetical protein
MEVEASEAPPPEDIMNAKRKVLTSVIAVLIAAPIALPSVAASKLYHWVSADGKDHYSDTLPPEALGQARQEINSNNGMTVKQVERAKTTEEIAAAQAQAAADAQAAEAAQKSKENDQALLASYSTEADLQHAYNQRIELQNESLKSTRVGVESVQQALKTMLVRASGHELAGRKVTSDLSGMIVKARKQLLDQQAQLVRLEAQSISLKQENTAQIARYRSLRAAADAANPAPGANSAPPPPNR